MAVSEIVISEYCFQVHYFFNVVQCEVMLNDMEQGLFYA